MKRAVSLFLLLAILLSLLVGCKEKYPKIESTDEEARVVATLSVGDWEYELKYELYRALFLTYKSEVDGGDPTVWYGDEKEKYIKEISEIIFGRAAEIFAVFELARRIGVDPYSKDIEKKIEQMIEVSVEGGVYDNKEFAGFGGDYDEYLDSLASLYHNYSTSVLLLRQELLRAELDRHYIGAITPEEIASGSLSSGAIKYDREIIRSFYDSEDCARVLITYVQDNTGSGAEARAESIRLEALEAAEGGEGEVRALFIDRGSPTAAGELIKGVLVAEHSLSYDYTELAEAALLLEVGGVSEVVKTYSASDGVRYQIIYRAEKTNEFFDECYTEIVRSYLYDAVGGMIKLVEDELKASVTLTQAGEEIIHSEIKM
nr:hypothetical protein [Clostridia bacterium]